MDNHSWSKFFPQNGDPSNRRFSTRAQPPPVPAPPPRPSKVDSRQSNYAKEQHTRAEAEHVALLRAKLEETRKKFDQLRIRNYVDHYFNMALLNVKLSKLLQEDKVKEGNKKRTKAPENFVFFSNEMNGLRYRSLKRGGKNEPFRVEINVKGYNPKNIHIDSTENRITIKATTVTGLIKTLGIICPTVEDVDKIIINIPKNGVLLIEGPTIR